MREADTIILKHWFDQHYQQGRLASVAVQAFLQQQNWSSVQLMRALLPIAESYARPVVSRFSVGAVVQGDSGALYLGANQEFAQQTLTLCLHAEQVAILNARAHHETGVQQLAITYSPCGFCRQFLLETCAADALIIDFADAQCCSLAQLLPHAFCAKHLQVQTAFWRQGFPSLVFPEAEYSLSSLANAALSAAQYSYAPYSHAYCGVALQLRGSDEIISGSYVENAAFNPSVLALPVALSLLALRNIDYQLIEQVCLVQQAAAVLDQTQVSKILLSAIAPRAQFSVKVGL